MKRIVVILILVVIPLFFSVKKKGRSLEPDMVECYYLKQTKEPLIVYNKINGSVIDTLRNFESKYFWYNLSISESKNNWFKVDSIFIGPSQIKGGNLSLEHCFNGWVETDKLRVSLWESGDYKLYSKPNLKSEYTDLSEAFYVGSIISVYNNWVKVQVKTEEVSLEGWVPRVQQCGMPWTNCCNNF